MPLNNDFRRTAGGMFLAWIIGIIIVIIANLALLAGGVWVVVWVLRETGVIK